MTISTPAPAPNAHPAVVFLIDNGDAPFSSLRLTANDVAGAFTARMDQVAAHQVSIYNIVD
jgi:hypothetical protein